MSSKTTVRFGDGAVVTAIPMVVGIVADLTGIPWIALASFLLLLAPRLRNALMTMEYFVIASVLAAAAVAAMTMTHNPDVWKSMWFVSLLGTGGVASLLCTVANLRKQKGSARLAFVLVHLSVPVILVGGGMKAAYKQEGMVELHEGETTAVAHELVNGFATGQTFELPFRVRLERFRVEFYPKRFSLYLFDARQPQMPIGQMELLEGERLQAGGVTIEMKALETETRDIAKSHGNIMLTSLNLEANGLALSFPIAATEVGKHIPLPFGEGGNLAQLAHDALSKSGGDTTDVTILRPLMAYQLAMDCPEEAEFEPSKCTAMFLDASAPDRPKAALPVDAPGEIALDGGKLKVKLLGTSQAPMKMGGDGPAELTITTAMLLLDGEPAYFPLTFEREGTITDLPLGDSVSLADLIRSSRAQFGTPQRELPALFDHMAIMVQAIESPRTFQSRLTLLDSSDQPLVSEEIQVNEPLRYDGWWLYQSDWDPRRPGFSGIQVVRDPGLWIALGGLFLLAAGALLHVRRMFVRAVDNGGNP